MISTTSKSDPQQSSPPPVVSTARASIIILGLCILLLVSSIPGQPDGLGVFTDPLIQDLHISRGTLSTALAIGTLIFGLLVPLTGQLMDRLGVTRIIMLAPITLAGMFLLLTQLPRLLSATSADNTALRIPLLAACFLLIRLMAQGCMGVGSRVVIGQSFKARRGLATGIFAATTTFAFNISPPILNQFVETWGWRQTYYSIAAYLVIVPPLCVAIFLYRSQMSLSGRRVGICILSSGPRAESYRSGRKHLGTEQDQPSSKISPRSPSPVLARVLRTPHFWIFAIGLSLQAMFMDSVKIHMTDLGASHGLSRSDTYHTFYTMAFVALVPNLLCGWISDKLKLKHLMAFMMSSQILACLGLASMGTLWGKALFAIGYGLGIGFFGVLNVVTWPRLFGPEGLGRIVSASLSITILAIAAGLFFFGQIKEQTSSYQVILYSWPVISLTMIVAAWLLSEIPSPENVE